MLDIKADFGAVGGDPALDTAAFQAAIANGPGVYTVPLGNYQINADLNISDMRSIRFVGEGGDAVGPGSRLWFSGGARLLVTSAVRARFQSMCFRAGANADHLISLNAMDAPKVSAIYTSFEDCSIYAPPGVALGSLVNMRNAVFPRFSECTLSGAMTAMIIGDAASTYPDTLAQGATNQVLIDRCHIFGDIIMRRSWHTTIRNNLFDYRLDGTLPLIGGHSSDKANFNVEVHGNFVGLSTVQPPTTRPFYIQGANGDQVQATMNSLRWVNTCFDIDGTGHAYLAGNTRISSGPLVNLRGKTNCTVENTNG